METPVEFLQKALRASALTSGNNYPDLGVDYESNIGMEKLAPMLVFKVKRMPVEVFASDLKGKSVDEIVEFVLAVWNAKTERLKKYKKQIENLIL